tara:strand:- start:6824 stop:7690 length:867 start_codon:yes stop_codon:yes gene_type:complete
LENKAIRKFDSLIISSRRNPLVKRLRSLQSKKGRDEYSMLLLEGTNLLKEALKTNFVPAEIVSTSSWLEKHSELLKTFSEQIHIHEVTESVLDFALSTQSPDGVASLFSLSGLPSLPIDPNYILALDRLQDPGNLGSLFRTALSADINMIWLGSGVDPLSQKVIRASAGSILHLPYERLGNNEDQGIKLLIEKLEEVSRRGFQIVGTCIPFKENPKNILPYWQIDWCKPTVLVLGNEGSGLHPEIQSRCTQLVTLPHNISVESLNVAAAAVPLLLERRRVKMIKGIHL